MNIPKITILLDHGYHPDEIKRVLQSVHPRIMSKIRFARSANCPRWKRFRATVGSFRLPLDGLWNGQMLGRTV
ncbi:MAG TPA: hypothetical protein V6D10_11320 [Trichocoleus sp.]